MLVKLPELKKFLKIEHTDEDGDLHAMLDRAHNEAEQIIDGALEETEYVEYYKGNGESILLLKQCPITEVASVYDDATRAWGASSLIPLASIQIDEKMGAIIYDGGVFSPSLGHVQNIKVTYTAGYTAETLPKAIRTGILKLASADYNTGSTNLNAVNNEVGAGGGKTTNLRTEATELLEMFRRYR